MSYDNKYDRPEGAGLSVCNDPQRWEASIPNTFSKFGRRIALVHLPDSDTVTICEHSNRSFYCEIFRLNTALLADLAHAFLVRVGDRRVKVI